MAEKPLPPGLHVVLGDSAAGTFDEAFAARDSLLIDRDVLSCGPTRRCDSIVDWQAMRDQFWRELAPMASADPPSTDRGLLENLDRLRDAQRLTIWAATSLTEQLFIAHVLHRAEAAGLDTSRIQIVRFESLRGSHGRVMGIGELIAKQLRDYPDAHSLSGADLRAYRDAWVALVSPEPGLLASFSQSHPDSDAWLNDAMNLMLRRFPDKQTGLTYWDRAILEGVKVHGPRAARVIGHVMTRDWNDADLTGDWYLFGRMLKLGRMPKSALELSGDVDEMRATEVRLTPFGLDILAGRASNYPTNPIEDWAAGVRLSSRDGELWFNDSGKLVRAGSG
jgi:hypothetical protein